MTTKTKKKLCWHCEGRVAVQDENCPYCGVSLAPLSIGGTKGNESLFSPPYRMDNSKIEQIPVSPYAMEEVVSPLEKVIPSEEVAAVAPEKPAKPSLEGIREILLPQLFLSSGLIFLLFGVMLALFSQKGIFVLQWDATYWFLYILLGLPFIGLGSFLLTQLKEK